MLGKSWKLLLIVWLSVAMSHAPEAVASEVAVGKMISTMAVVDSLSRQDLEAKVQKTLERQDLQDQLRKMGVDPSEASQRVASLSDSELQNLASQMDKHLYGGEALVGILIIAVLVLLIIYLAKRI